VLLYLSCKPNIINSGQLSEAELVHADLPCYAIAGNTCY